MEGVSPNLFCIETGEDEILREPNGNPRFFTLEDAKRWGTSMAKPDIIRDTDIFQHLDKLDLTERIYIVAPGKNGVKHYGKLDPDCFTIIVNKACEIPLARRDLWMVADPTVYNLKRGIVPWFAEGVESCGEIACFDSGALLDYFKDVRYTHEWGPEITDEFIEPIENRMLGGLTISGRALQMAYWLGAKEIILCGVDLSGSLYFDDTDRGTEAQKHTAWTRVLPIFQQLCDWLKEHGVKVSSLSETALDIPRSKPRKKTKRSK